jgi:sulfur carrier protein
MKIVVNAQEHDTNLDTLNLLLDELGHETRSVATAVNGEFVPVSERETYVLKAGDAVEIIAPMAGG